MSNLGEPCVECGLTQFDSVHSGERKPRLNPQQIVVGGTAPIIVREWIEPHEFAGLFAVVRMVRDDLPVPMDSEYVRREDGERWRTFDADAERRHQHPAAR